MLVLGKVASLPHTFRAENGVTLGGSHGHLEDANLQLGACKTITAWGGGQGAKADERKDPNKERSFQLLCLLSEEDELHDRCELERGRRGLEHSRFIFLSTFYTEGCVEK